MKCPHCRRDITPKISAKELAALRYMIGKGWLFSGTIDGDAWKKDPELVEWLNKGWIDMDRSLGFRITPVGITICQS